MAEEVADTGYCGLFPPPGPSQAILLNKICCACSKSSSSGIVEKIQSLLAAQKFVECVMLCNLQQDLQQPNMRQAWAVADIHLAAERCDWAKVVDAFQPLMSIIGMT